MSAMCAGGRGSNGADAADTRPDEKAGRFLHVPRRARQLAGPGSSPTSTRTVRFWLPDVLGWLFVAKRRSPRSLPTSRCYRDCCRAEKGIHKHT
ncbi:unnamed protein product, partial [Iphiclides podalirius]